VLIKERGTHRLTRLSPFCKKGKTQTSFCSVDVVPELPEVKFKLNERDLKFEQFCRASGPGGQNKNKTATAFRVVHIPTGTVAVSSTYREALQNRKMALSALMATLSQEFDEQQAKIRKEIVGECSSGTWGTQIRTYNLIKSRVKDHRTNIESNRPQDVLNGDLEKFLQ
jgi:peptide chain release factor 2